MRIATWNVNSLNARQPRVEEWLQIAKPDVLCLQEVKLSDAKFPHLAFKSLGYESAYFGEGRWNGVAILSKVGLESPRTGFEACPDCYEGDARVLTADCGGITVISTYVPNGRAIGTDFYERKLQWFGEMRDWLTKNFSPDDPIVMVGDFNVAPEDRDVWSIKAYGNGNHPHVSPDVRAALQNVRDWGFVDAFRKIYPNDDRLFTFWDYQRGDFHQGRGMRLDHILVTKPLTDRVSWALVDRNARKGERPSDHAPVFVDLTP